MKRLLLLLLCAAPVWAQSNIAAGYVGQTSTSNGNNNTVVLISFTTGANSSGYNVASCKIFVANAAGANSLQCGIYADSSGPTGSAICSSSGISTVNGWNTLTPSGCGTLTASTKYWLAQNTNSATQSNGFTAAQCPGLNGAGGDNWYFATNTYGSWGALTGLSGNPSDCFSQYVILTPVSGTGASIAAAFNYQCSAGVTCASSTTNKSIPVTSGEAVVVTCFTETNTTCALADSNTDTYTTLASNTFDGATRFMSEFCVVYSGADTNLSITTTVGISIQQYITMRTYAQLTCNIDGTAQTADVTSTTPATGSFTTSVQPDLALCDAAFVTSPTSVAAGSGYTLRQTFGTGGTVSLASADRGGAGTGINTGSYTCGYTLGNSQETGLIGLALKGSNASAPVGGQKGIAVIY